MTSDGPSTPTHAFGAPAPDHVIRPSAEQQRAIEHDDRPLLIVAGAGSGKTTVMAKRMVHFVHHERWRPEQLLGLTFSNKAAANLRTRAAQELGTGSDVTVMTYHGFGAAIVTERWPQLGFLRPPTLIDKARSWQLLLAALDDATLTTRKTGRISSLVTDTLTLASSCADHLVTIDDVARDAIALRDRSDVHQSARNAAASRLDLCELVRVYQDAKRRYGCIDFGDQIRLAVEAVAADPEYAATLLDRYPVLLLDEYQDTNFAQRRLLQIIYGTSPRVTAVGDDMQSIYAFRGAHIENILRFSDFFPEAQQLRLETNHRSAAAIVDLANSVQLEVSHHLEKTLTGDPTKRLSLERFVAADDRSEADAIASRCASLHESGTSWSEIAVLCRKKRLIPAIVSALQRVGVPVEAVGLGGLLVRPEIIDLVAWLELVAAHAAETTAPDRSVANAAVPARWSGPDASVALLRILRGPRFRIGLRDLAALARRARALQHRADAPDPTDATSSSGSDKSASPDRPSARSERREHGTDQRIDLLAALDDPHAISEISPEAWSRFTSFAALRERLVGALTDATVPEFLEIVLARTGLWEQVDDLGHQNLLRFLDLLDRFEPLVPAAAAGTDLHDRTSLRPRGRAALLDVLEYLELIRESEDDISEAVATDLDAVRVMTIHQAKGLEFDAVFVPGLSGSGRSLIFPDERLADSGVTQSSALPPWLRGDADPTIPPLSKTKDLNAVRDAAKVRRRDEELRLLYVAITRARHHLVCSAAHWYPGPAIPQGPSDFYGLLASVPETFHEPPPILNPLVAEREARAAALVERIAQRATPVKGAGMKNETASERTRAKRSTPHGGQGQLLTDEANAEPSSGSLPALPAVVAATGLAVYDQCPRRFFWSFVQPLPRQFSPQALFGTKVHRWLEKRADPQLSFDFAETADVTPWDAAPLGESDVASDESEVVVDLASMITGGGRAAVDDLESEQLLTGEASQESQESDRPESERDRFERTTANFLSTSYAHVQPERVEAPFVLTIDAHVVPNTIRGRIDAVYRIRVTTDADVHSGDPEPGPTSGTTGPLVELKHDDIGHDDIGHDDIEYVDIVDYKSGRAPSGDDRTTLLQLGIYALVAVDQWKVPPSQLRTTALYLGGDRPELRATRWDAASVAAMRAHVERTLRGIGGRFFSPNGGTWCRACDFADFCPGAQPPGTAV